LSDAELGELLVALRRLQHRLEREAHAAAKRQVALGRCLREMPGADAAWASGAIGAAHVAALSRARAPATEDVYARG
jgi:hypothetical protein